MAEKDITEEVRQRFMAEPGAEFFYDFASNDPGYPAVFEGDRINDARFNEGYMVMSRKEPGIVLRIIKITKEELD